MAFDNFVNRHIGLSDTDIQSMLRSLGVDSLDDLMNNTIPHSIRLDSPLNLPDGLCEFEYIRYLKEIISKNKIYKSYIGQGFYNTFLPAVIQRNILENPGWYTSYTPYQAEISQGRLEALLNFQTMIIELTGLEIANASLLDESTAASEAMIMLYNSRKKDVIKADYNTFFMDKNIFPQTISVVKTKAELLGINLIIDDIESIDWKNNLFGILIQYPGSDGSIKNYKDFVLKAHDNKCNVAVIADILSLAILIPPGEWGADVTVGSVQRFGLPMGYGGPHAGYMAAKEEFKRFMPGRIIGLSKDSEGNPALRMALQTREQHIKREKATSNICTAQALLAIMSSFFAVYHGKEGLQRIALHCHSLAGILNEKFNNLGFIQQNKDFFDTLKITLPENITSDTIRSIANDKEINFRYYDEKNIGISLDETTTINDINDIIEVFAIATKKAYKHVKSLEDKTYFNNSFLRKSDFFSSKIFNQYRTETCLMRYMKKLERKDISLNHSMISLGSCTMKLNAAVEMLPLSWSEIGNIHPFVPLHQAQGYQYLIHELEQYLKEITGFAAVSFQPNSGAAGEYSGLALIRKYHEFNGNSNRKIVLIPSSAHGTNPASAVMAGLYVLIVNCDSKGNIDLNDLKNKTEENKNDLAALMVTYPSTHGVFEDNIVEITKMIHAAGGQVYMDGANMNAQVGLTNPAKIGADVCHLNLHKTFAIPHGGGGPGMGPIAVAEHLVEFLPAHPVVETGGINGLEAVSSSPWGSASILVISHAYCKLLGGKGLTLSTKTAILNANYIAKHLEKYYGILYKGSKGFVAHEMILDCRQFKKSANITEIDIAKRLMDYGFHAPTVSFPVHGTLMVEPTESESKTELDRFIETMISIYNEIMEIKNNNIEDNVLKNSPHTQALVLNDIWDHPYTREKAVFPLEWIKQNKFWPTVSRIDDAYGDRNLICSCSL